MNKAILIAAAFPFLAGGQTQVDLRTQGKSVDFTNASTTRPVKTGNTLPATCSAGDMFFLLTAPAGANVYGCNTSNNWSAQGGGASLAVQNNGTLTGTRPIENFVPGTGILTSISDDGTRLNVQHFIDPAIVETKASEQSGAVFLCASTSGSASAYTCALHPTLASYTSGMMLRWKPDVNGAGGSTTLNIDSIGAAPVKMQDGTSNPSASTLIAGNLYEIWYDGSAFRVFSSVGATGTSFLSQNSDSSLSAPRALLFPAPAATSAACDWSLSNSCTVTASGGNVTVTFANPHGSGPYILGLCNDAAARTWTLPATAKNAVSPAVASSCTYQHFQYDGSTNYQGLAATSTELPSIMRGTERAAPGAPATGTDACWFDSADHTWECMGSGNTVVSKMFQDAVDAGPASGQVFSTSMTLGNAPTTGTVANKLVKLTGSPSTGVTPVTSDTTGIVGICLSGCGLTSSAIVTTRGRAFCIFDGTTVAGDYVQISASVAGDCHDAGPARPTSGQILGRVLSTNGVAGTYQIDFTPLVDAQPSGGAATISSLTGGTANGVVVAGGSGVAPTSVTGGTDTALMGSAGAPSFVAVTNCGDSSHALAYSTATHSYSCQAITGSTGAPAFPLNAQTGAYQAQASDFASCKVIPVASGTFTVTLVASPSQPSNGQCLWVINYGSGTVTVARNGQNINGGTSNLSLAGGSAAAPSGAFIVSDATNYFAQVFGAGSGGGGGAVSGLTAGLIPRAASSSTLADSTLSAPSQAGTPFVILSSQLPAADTLACATIGTTETTFASNYAIPANFFDVGRVLRIEASFEQTGSAGPTITPRIRLGGSAGSVAGTSVYTSLAGALPGGAFESGFMVDLAGTGAPGPAVTVRTGVKGAVAAFARSSTTSLNAVATNSSLLLQVTMTCSAATAGNSLQLTHLLVEGN